MSCGFKESSQINNSEIFNICMMGFDGILKNVSYKDCIQYSVHNKCKISPDLFESSLHFNLFSQYGLGVSLKIILSQLYKTGSLCPELNKNNPLFLEILKLSQELSILLRSKNKFDLMNS